MSEANYGMHKRVGYSDPSPYPEIKVQGPNINYAELLMDRIILDEKVHIRLFN